MRAVIHGPLSAPHERTHARAWRGDHAAAAGAAGKILLNGQTADLIGYWGSSTNTVERWVTTKKDGGGRFSVKFHDEVMAQDANAPLWDSTSWYSYLGGRNCDEAPDPEAQTPLCQGITFFVDEEKRA